MSGNIEFFTINIGAVEERVENRRESTLHVNLNMKNQVGCVKSMEIEGTFIFAAKS